MLGHQISSSQIPKSSVTKRTRQNVNSQEVCNLLSAKYEFKGGPTCSISSTSIIESPFYFLNNVAQADFEFSTTDEDENRESDDCRNFDQSLTRRWSPLLLHDNNIRNIRNSWDRTLLGYMRQLISKYSTMKRELMSANPLGPIIMLHKEHEQHPMTIQDLEKTIKIKFQGPNSDDTCVKKFELIESYIENALRAKYEEARSRALRTPRSSVHTTCAPAVALLSPSDLFPNTNGISIQLLKLAVMLYAPRLMSALNILIARCPQATIPHSYSEDTNDALTQIFNMLVAQQVTPNLQAAMTLDVSTENSENYTTNVSNTDTQYSQEYRN